MYHYRRRPLEIFYEGWGPAKESSLPFYKRELNFEILQNYLWKINRTVHFFVLIVANK